MGEATSIRYRAFLSYSHGDTRWAKWLHGRIEGFRVDKDLVGRDTPMGQISKNLRPIFRDRHDFSAGGTLREQTIAALDASAALVVLCSPASANSAAVNEEVRQFISRHPDRPVIPVILAGAPGGVANECFPKALRFAIAADGSVSEQAVGVLAADVRESGDGRKLALAKVVARLVGLGPDEVFRRAERERRRQGRVRNAVIGMLALLALAASGSAAYAWQELKTNEAFLDATLEHFTGLVKGSVLLSRSYAVPLSVSLGMLQEAEGMLDVMAKYGRDTPKLKYRRAQMLIAFADNYRDLGQTSEWERRIDEAHGIMVNLVRADADNLAWVAELAAVTDRAGDLAIAKGYLNHALESFRDSVAIEERLATSAPNNAGSQRNLAVSYQKVGDVLVVQGNLTGALQSYRADLAISERLAKVDPANTNWQRQLSVSCERVGNVLMAQGKLTEALQSYRDGHVIKERLTKTDPTNAGWQRDLSVSHNKVGDVLVAQGSVTEGLQSYRDGVAIAERLTNADPHNALWQRDLAVSYDKVGSVLMAQGNRPAALQSYRDGLAIRERLAKADPDNAGGQRDLSVSLNKVGDVLMKQGSLPEALQSYRDGLAIREHLAKGDPNNALWQRDLSLSYNDVGDVLVAQGNQPEALESYRNSLAIAERLSQADPNNAGWQADLAANHGKLGQLYRAMGQDEKALEMFRAGRDIVAPLAERSENVMWKQYLASFDRDIAGLTR